MNKARTVRVLAIATAALLIGALVVVGVGYTAWAHRPYTVTGWSAEVSGGVHVLRIRFNSPTGGSSSIDIANSQSVNRCYPKLVLGHPIPNECKP